MTKNEIHMIGNPRNTKKHIFRGRSGFLSIYPEIFYIIIIIIIIIEMSTFAFKFYHGGMKYPHRAKCADIKFSGWFFACPLLAE